MVADMNSKSDGEKTVAIYPKEGSIWGDIVFSEVYSSSINEEQKQAVREIKKLFLEDNIQKKGMNEYFFRPANTGIALSEAISQKMVLTLQSLKQLWKCQAWILLMLF